MQTSLAEANAESLESLNGDTETPLLEPVSVPQTKAALNSITNAGIFTDACPSVPVNSMVGTAEQSPLASEDCSILGSVNNVDQLGHSTRDKEHRRHQVRQPHVYVRWNKLVGVRLTDDITN